MSLPTKEPVEVAVARWLATTLEGMDPSVGSYYRKPDHVWRVQEPEIVILGEYDYAIFVHHGECLYVPEASCTDAITCDFFLLALQRFKDGDTLPWDRQAGADVEDDLKLRVVADVRHLLAQDMNPKAGGLVDSIYVADRNLNVPVPGWAAVEIRLAALWSDTW